MGLSNASRRLFVGDLHGCREELDGLLRSFGFRPGIDRLHPVGDIMGKGPDAPGVLQRLAELDAQPVVGNHDKSLLMGAALPASQRRRHQQEYLDSLGPDPRRWLDYIASWPLYRDLGDLILVHAGLEPGVKRLGDMSERALVTIRTWDGKGDHLNRPDNPPWFECVKPPKPVVFGHWAQRGLVDLPLFKGLDTGCVYGGRLTGWCPEENRFLQIDAKRAYSPIHRD